MSRPLVLATCALVPLAMAAGCGSSEKAHTASTSADNGPPPYVQSTGPSGVAENTAKTSKAGAPSSANAAQSAKDTEEVKRKLESIVQHPVSAATAETVKQKAGTRFKVNTTASIRQKIEAVKRKIEGNVSIAKQYTGQDQLQWEVDCKYDDGPPTVCKCILERQENLNVSSARSLAELLALEYAVSVRTPLIQAVNAPVPFPGSGLSRGEFLPEAIRHTLKTCLR